RGLMEENNIDIPSAIIVDPRMDEAKRRAYGAKLFEKRGRRGMTEFEAEYAMRNRNYFGSMMVELGEADAFISGLTRNYPIALKPALECIGMDESSNRVSGMHIMMSKSGPLFFADTTVNISYSDEQLHCMIMNVYQRVKEFQIEPRIALISYSNFGSSGGENPQQLQRVLKRIQLEYPDMKIDGEMQPVYAMNGDLRFKNYPFNKLGKEAANTYIFSQLSSGNSAYQLMRGMGGVSAIGPVLLGFKKSVHILHHSSTVREIVNMLALAVTEAQDKA
ncbi:MAG: phosphate acyltransferase, partial [Bacteroidia bacterium]